MGKNKVRGFLSIVNLGSFVGTIVVNGLANMLPLNHKTTGVLADQYPNLFVPAGLTFSIWGVIYVLLAIFIVNQLVYSFKKDTASSSFMEKIGILFFISALANLGWIFAWHYEIIVLSLVLMLVLLASLVAIYLRLNIGRSSAARSERYLVHLPFSIYLGWITVATIANATAVLVHFHWTRFGLSEPFWTVLVMAVGIVLGLWMLFYRRDIFYGLVVLWAFLGILIKRLTVDVTPVHSIVAAAIAGMALLAICSVVQLLGRRVY